MYRAKAGHVVRVLGRDTALAAVTAREVDRFVDVRLAEAPRALVTVNACGERVIVKLHPSRHRAEGAATIFGRRPFTQVAPQARSRNRPEQSSGVHDHPHDHDLGSRSRKSAPDSATKASAIGAAFRQPKPHHLSGSVDQNFQTPS
jgi:hypothetical protein